MSLGFQGPPLGNPNDCTSAYAPEFWLGKPGALALLRMPDAGVTRSANDRFSVHDLLEGQAVDRAAHRTRSWAMQHQWLRPEVTSVLQEFATRQRGIGPFVFVDPHMKNLLTPNQASGTDALHTTEGFAVSGTGVALSSSTVGYVQGERSLAWTMSPPVTGTANILRVVAPTDLYGFVAPPGKTIAFSGWLKSAIGADSSVQAAARLVFMNGAGATSSTVTGVTIVTTTGAATTGWQQFCVTGQMPAVTSAVYFEPQVVVTGSSVAASTTVLLDQLQLELRDSGGCTTWEWGQGQPLVAVQVTSETVPRILRTTLGFNIVEVT